MIQNIALGRYIPYNSLVNRMDPRSKILILFILMIAIFIPAGFFGYIGVVLYILLALKESHLSLGFALRSIKPMSFMLVFLLIINILVIKTGVPLIEIGWFSVWSDAIIQTLYIVIRLTLMIILTTILTATTKPLDLTLGIEKLLKPFEKIGLPTHIIAMMISIALRFIPTLIEETNRIMNAQASRGVDLENGKIHEKVLAILSLIVPLFVSSFERADQLANAMEARGYDPNKPRTRYKTLQYQKVDYMALTLAVVVLIINLILWMLMG